MQKERPTSPHLQIYKPQLTSVLSITHRFTGIFLSVGVIALCWWLISLNLGEEAYRFFLSHFQLWYGKFFIVVWLFCFYYHLCNGLRHLYWDIGKGYDLKKVYVSGWAVVVFSTALTLVTIIKAL